LCGILHGVVQNCFTIRTHLVQLFQSTVAASHAGGENK
jgi:hypothetical protein